MNKAEKTRQFIIEKTAPIFNRKGYAGTSLSDMTEATGLTKGSIYGNFADKDEVALAAFDYNIQKITAFIQSELGKHKTARERLLAYVSIYDGFQRNTAFFNGCPIQNTVAEADDTHPALKSKACVALLNWKDKMANIIREGIGEGDFKPDTDPEESAFAIVALIEGSILITKATGKANYRKAVMNTLEKLIKAL